MVEEKNKAKIFLLSTLAFIGLGLFVLLLFLQANFTQQIGGDFTLYKNQQTWVFHDQAKKLNLLYFGYTKCPDVCPLTLSFVAQALPQLSSQQLANLQIIFVNLDHGHDSAETVTRFAEQFAKNFVGLSGSQAQIDAVVSQYRASYVLEKKPDSYLGYTIMHPDGVFFLNDKGLVIDMLISPRTSASIAEKIKEHLKEYQ